MNDADALFDVPPDRFVAARDALAKQLKKEQPEEAKRIAKLRRPSRSVWALNLLARHHGGLISEVLDAGAALRHALENVAADRSAWRDAQAAERQAIDVAVATAGDAAGGLNDADRGRVTETLRAAVVDPEVADRLTRGVLTEDAIMIGFGVEGATFPPAAPPARQDPVEAERERKRRARRAELEAAALRLRRRADRLHADAERAARTADDARRDADQAEVEAAAAEEQLASDR